MVFWVQTLIRVLRVAEDHLVDRVCVHLICQTPVRQYMILHNPGFHNAVRRIHRRVEDHRHGRDPNEPMRPGEATELDNQSNKGGFMKHFLDELWNQARGTPSDPSPPPPPRDPQPPRR